MAKKKEGAAVLKAMAGPNVDPDKLLMKHAAWSAAETDANSDAGERRQAIGAVADEMRIEGKALSWFRSLLKIKNEGRRRDALLSLEALLPIARGQIMGNQPDMLERAAADLAPETGNPATAPVEPATLADVAHLTGDDGYPDPDLDEDLEDMEDGDETGPFDDDLDEDVADFADALADLEPAGNVVKAFGR
jgi:hypothetical protein